MLDEESDRMVMKLIDVLHYQAGIDEDEEMRQVADALAKLHRGYRDCNRCPHYLRDCDDEV